MPGGNRTGPRGQGPMTGRGLGYCTGFDSPGFTVDQGYGFGRSYGRFSRGRGRGYVRAGYIDPYFTPYRLIGSYLAPRIPVSPPVDQLTMLKQEKNYLDSELKEIGSALEDISKKIEELERKE